MKKLLSFKHWQIFLLIVICGAWVSPSPFREIINSISVTTFILWIYAVGVYGQERISELGLQPMNTKLFKTNIIVLGVLAVIGLIYSASQAKIINYNNTFEPKDIIFIIVGVYFCFAFFQTIIFSCKTISKLESKREVSFGDYSNNIFLIIFLFIGIWVLQPKINKLFVTQEQDFTQ